jgi:uncharacterized membrane protein YgcG
MTLRRIALLLILMLLSVRFLSTSLPVSAPSAHIEDAAPTADDDPTGWLRHASASVRQEVARYSLEYIGW